MRAIQNSFQQWRSTEGNSTEKEKKKEKIPIHINSTIQLQDFATFKCKVTTKYKHQRKGRRLQTN